MNPFIREDWYLASLGRTLIWARLRLLEAGTAEVLDSDGNTLAVHAPTEPEDFSCGSFAARAWAIALYARTGTTWQRQTAISRGIAGNWALASDGNALFYGGSTFTRSNGTWACP